MCYSARTWSNAGLHIIQRTLQILIANPAIVEYIPYFLCQNTIRPVMPMKNNTPPTTDFHSDVFWFISAKLWLKLMWYTEDLKETKSLSLNLLMKHYVINILQHCILKNSKYTSTYGHEWISKNRSVVQSFPTCNLLLIRECSPGAPLLLLQGLLLWTQVLHIADIGEGILPPVKVDRERVVLYLSYTCRWKVILKLITVCHLTVR